MSAPRLTLKRIAPAFMSWPIPAFESIKAQPGYTEAHVWQKGRCAMCGGHEGNASRRHALDHDHDTGLIRGLLCTSCNLQEGWQPNYQFEMWRNGLNPCTVFGWHYRWNGPGFAPTPLKFDEAAQMVRNAAIREEIRRNELREAIASMDEAMDNFLAPAGAETKRVAS